MAVYSKKHIGWVYAVMDSRSGFAKVGFAKDPKSRRINLQTGNPFPVTHIGEVKGTLAAERAMHELFAEYRVAGEWFSCPLAIAGALDAMMEALIDAADDASDEIGGFQDEHMPRVHANEVEVLTAAARHLAWCKANDVDALLPQPAA